MKRSISRHCLGNSVRAALVTILRYTKKGFFKNFKVDISKKCGFFMQKLLPYSSQYTWPTALNTSQRALTLGLEVRSPQSMQSLTEKWRRWRANAHNLAVKWSEVSSCPHLGLSVDKFSQLCSQMEWSYAWWCSIITVAAIVVDWQPFFASGENAHSANFFSWA